MMKDLPDKIKKRAPITSFMVGIVALVFLAIGYQTALFIHTASVEKIVSGRDEPDTVFVYRIIGPDGGNGRTAGGTAGGTTDRTIGGTTDRTIGGTTYRTAGGTTDRTRCRTASVASGQVGGQAGGQVGGQAPGKQFYGDGDVERRREGNRAVDEAGDEAGGTSESGRYVEEIHVRKNASHSPEVMAIRAANPPRNPELFTFDPNQVTVDELVRLGFSSKQAHSIVNYRSKGGRFRRKTDFARSYVVSEQMYERLEPYIDIPKVDINTADSAALDALPGIGGYFVKKIMEYRKALSGYSFPEQLMDIYHFDQEKFDGLSDLITVGPSEPYPLWTLPADSLKRHPYVGNYGADGVVLFRKHHPKDQWTVENLAAAGILRPECVPKLARCRILSP